jgi:hypothetical protein
MSSRHDDDDGGGSTFAGEVIPGYRLLLSGSRLLSWNGCAEVGGIPRATFFASEFTGRGGTVCDEYSA